MSVPTGMALFFGSEEGLPVALLSMPVSPAAPDNGHGALHRRSVATGYLVGRLERFNNAKKKEVADRVVHGFRR